MALKEAALQIRLDEELRRRLDEEAAREEMPVSAWARRELRRALEARRAGTRTDPV